MLKAVKFVLILIKYNDLIIYNKTVENLKIIHIYYIKIIFPINFNFTFLSFFFFAFSLIIKLRILFLIFCTTLFETKKILNHLNF